MSRKFLKRGIPAFIKSSTIGVLDIDSGYENTISAINEESVKTLIENYSKDKNVLIEFKKAIEKVLNEIDDEKPFILSIDKSQLWKYQYK